MTGWRRTGRSWRRYPITTGGYYVGGLFTTIGGVGRSNLAHVRADGSVDPGWHPAASSFVTALALSGSTVYAGGWFTSISGHRRHYLAALSTRTGRVTAWNPNPDKAVADFAVSGSTVYVGGYFTRIGGQARNGIAALGLTTGSASAWTPNALPPDSGVVAVAASGATVYAGGKFGRIGGQARNGIAALNTATGRVVPLSLLDMSGAFALVVSGSSLYVGGDDGVATVAITP